MQFSPSDQNHYLAFFFFLFLFCARVCHHFSPPVPVTHSAMSLTTPDPITPRGEFQRERNAIPRPTSRALNVDQCNQMCHPCARNDGSRSALHWPQPPATMHVLHVVSPPLGFYGDDRGTHLKLWLLNSVSEAGWVTNTLVINRGLTIRLERDLYANSQDNGEL